MRINWSRLWFAVVFSVIENDHFGWNFSPHSDAELICDGIFLLICALSFERKTDLSR